MTYSKRLIEVDLPIKRISAHARREKSIRHGHISTLHIWWARRPLAACRAVICASLWPDPADPNCPQSFRDLALKHLFAFAKAAQIDIKLSEICDNGSWQRYMRLSRESEIDTTSLKGQIKLRAYLLDFIADFAAWEASTNRRFLDTARSLTQAAHEALGGEKGTRPLVVDPFAGGGAIPLEALRVGADAFASDLNPVAVLLNKVVLEYIPKFGKKLAEQVLTWGKWIEQRADAELAEFYPKGSKGETPIAYLWARTITCEGPSCGAEIPLMRSLWLAKKGQSSVALKIVSRPKLKRVDFEIIYNAQQKDVAGGTIRRGAATCPCCGYTTPVTSMRVQLRPRRGGADDARLIAVRYDDAKSGDRSWRLGNDQDMRAVLKARERLDEIRSQTANDLSVVPEEPLPPTGTLGFRVQNYGMLRWGDLFTARQALSLVTLGRLARSAPVDATPDLTIAVRTCLALAVDRLADFNASLCVLNSVGGRGVVHVFGRQAIPMVWDFMETNPFNTEAANWRTCYEVVDEVIENECVQDHSGTIMRSDAANHPLPDGTAAAFITDPPYYDAVPYADLSDYFYVWLRRNLPSEHAGLIALSLTDKEHECIVDPVRKKGSQYFQQQMGRAMAEGRRVLQPNGVGIVVFAHKSTSGWEAQLQAMVDAGWTITGSWPIDTERPGRLRAQDSAALASSVHLVCRPREYAAGRGSSEDIGDWRDVLTELPKRLHEWMERLSSEGVVGADAIFACLGPALQIFSQYSRVEKANGSQVMLREFLEQVWGTVAKEALRLVFSDADTRGFEADARLTAIWFWVLNTPSGDENSEEAEDAEPESDEETGGLTAAKGGFVMEFDAARKLAQGLGLDLHELSQPGSILSIKGSVATLINLSEREQHLIGRQLSLESSGDEQLSGRAGKNRNAKLLSIASRKSALFDPVPPPIVDSAQPYLPGMKPAPDERPLMQRLLENGKTVLDRLHQVMLLFGRGQSSLIGDFLAESSMATDQRFWTLAQAMSSLYPKGTDEKRWVDGVLARKRSLGL